MKISLLSEFLAPGVRRLRFELLRSPLLRQVTGRSEIHSFGGDKFRSAHESPMNDGLPAVEACWEWVGLTMREVLRKGGWPPRTLFKPRP